MFLHESQCLVNDTILNMEAVTSSEDVGLKCFYSVWAELKTELT